MDKLLRLGIIVAVLMAGYGVYYHYVIFLPRIESEKAINLERERLEASERDNARRVAYGSCLESAQSIYSANWAFACHSVADASARALKNCLGDKMIIANQFMGADYCKRTYGIANDSADCSLPVARAQSINAAFTQAKEQCATEAKLGLR